MAGAGDKIDLADSKLFCFSGVSFAAAALYFFFFLVALLTFFTGLAFPFTPTVGGSLTFTGSPPTEVSLALGDTEGVSISLACFTHSFVFFSFTSLASSPLLLPSFLFSNAASAPLDATGLEFCCCFAFFVVVDECSRCNRGLRRFRPPSALPPFLFMFEDKISMGGWIRAKSLIRLGASSIVLRC